MTSPFRSLSGDAEVHLATEPTSELQLSYIITATVMWIAHCLLRTGAWLNLIHLSMITTNCAYWIKQKGSPTLCTATKQPLPLKRLNLLNLSIGNFSSRVWFRLASQLANDRLLGTPFTDRFIRGVFPSKRKVLLSLSELVSTTAKRRVPKPARRTNLITEEPVSATYRFKVETDRVYDNVVGAKQIEQQLYTGHYVLVNTQSCGLLRMEPIDLSRHIKLAARVVM